MRTLPADHGSSPLTRGKPTDAWRSIRRTWAHPRSRGENPHHRGPRMGRAGSSPLTRGKRDRDGLPAVRRRLIPAHAGKTDRESTTQKEPRAHPRSRGENRGHKLLDVRFHGSSPLTRGKPRSHPGCVWSGRLIPAHAGKTSTPGPTCRPSRAHPRSRGENAPHSALTRSTRGSSPLTRGKRVTQLLQGHIGRLIPAHAGKTTPPPEASEPLWAHPRSRGENTRCGPFRLRGPPAHPRSRGENH